jgi:hypothetical protein
VRCAWLGTDKAWLGLFVASLGVFGIDGWPFGDLFIFTSLHLDKSKARAIQKALDGYFVSIIVDSR